MIQALNHRTFIVAILVSVLAYIVRSSGCNEQAYQNTSCKFAEIQGQVSEPNQVSKIRRWLFVGQDGSKAVVSEINSITEFSDYKSSVTHYLHEYLYDDSLFVYDSSDSTCISLVLEDVSYMELNLFRLSASWLFFNAGKSNNTLTDTLTICGYGCKKMRISDGYLWVSGNESMAIETLNLGISHSERITRYVNDTILPEWFLKHPSGYRELTPNR